MAARDHYLLVCQNVRPDDSPRPSCGRSGATEIYAALKAELNRRGLGKTVARACGTTCLDMCDDGPVILVQPGNYFYRHMTVERVPAVVQALIDGVSAEEQDDYQAPSYVGDEDR